MRARTKICSLARDLSPNSVLGGIRFVLPCLKWSVFFHEYYLQHIHLCFLFWSAGYALWFWSHTSHSHDAYTYTVYIYLPNCRFFSKFLEPRSPPPKSSMFHFSSFFLFLILLIDEYLSLCIWWIHVKNHTIYSEMNGNNKHENNIDFFNIYINYRYIYLKF